MNEKIKELAIEAGFYANPDVAKFEKFAKLLIEESIIDFYRRCLDTTSNEDITVQVERYIRDYVGGE